MKKLATFFVVIFLINSCSDDETESVEPPCLESNYVSFIDDTNLPEKRGYSSTASTNNYIYLSRGAKINTDGIIKSRSNDIITYDIDSKSWTEITGELIELNWGNIEIYNSKIYLLNGKIQGGLNNSVEVFDLITKEITLFNGINPYPVKENGSDIWKFHNIIFFGGTDSDGNCSDKIIRYNLLDNSFENIASLPFGICNTKGEIIDDKLYIIGGYLGSEVSNKVLVFDLNNNSFLDEITIPVSISAHTTSKYKNKIFIKGDYNIQNLFAVFDTSNNSFKIIDSNVIESRHSMSEIIDGKLYVIGGNTTSQFSTMTNKVQSLNLETEGYFCYD